MRCFRRSLRPVVGLILYLLWTGDRPSKRLSLKKPVPIEEPLAQQELARTNLEKLRQTAPQWYPLAAYLSGKGFDLYRNTALRYLPTGEAYLEDQPHHRHEQHQNDPAHLIAGGPGAGPDTHGHHTGQQLQRGVGQRHALLQKVAEADHQRDLRQKQHRHHHQP